VLGDCRESIRKVLGETKDISPEELAEYAGVLNQIATSKGGTFTYFEDVDEEDEDDDDIEPYDDDDIVDLDIKKLFGYTDRAELLNNYTDWYVTYVAKKMIAKDTAHFWSDWQMSDDMRECFDNMTVLEERVLYLVKGVGDGQPRSVEEIAAMPEFDCPREFIKSVSLGVDRTFAKKLRLRELDDLIKKYTKTQTA
jgi:hypothetical protein